MRQIADIPDQISVPVVEVPILPMVVRPSPFNMAYHGHAVTVGKVLGSGADPQIADRRLHIA
jgi:hypothetical protein